MLSFPHLVVLFVIALVIFGPQKLPELARMLGKATAEFRKMTNDFRFALEDEVRELERQTRIPRRGSRGCGSLLKPLCPLLRLLRKARCPAKRRLRMWPRLLSISPSLRRKLMSRFSPNLRMGPAFLPTLIPMRPIRRPNR